MPQRINPITQGLEAYQARVNIELFNDVVAFVMASTAADTGAVRRALTDNHIWYSRSESENIQERYGFRYFGELLERFEDRAGADIRDIRAIALAMASTQNLLTDDMFVGSQRAGFIRKITRLSPDDVYLKAALYLLGRFEPNGVALREELMQASYACTEELLFVASLLEDFSQAVEAFKPQFINLLGAGRTMPVYGNIRVYSWLIRQVNRFHETNGIRAKDLALLRALIELPVSFVKPGNKYHGTLLDNGYSAEEIIYLNSAILDCRPVAKTINTRSIVAEKIAIEFCGTFINSEAAHHEEVYDHLAQLLIIHSEFNIKINGYKGIFHAIKDSIHIANPQTFMRLYKLIEKKDIFRFDILDDKWDVLSRDMDYGDYLQVFERQMDENTQLAREQILAWIQTFDLLTGTSYLDIFAKKHEWHRDSIFSLLVHKGVLDLKTTFLSCTGLESVKDNDDNDARPPILIYLRTFIKGIRSREAFDFVRFFLSEYSLDDVNRLFDDVSRYYRNPANFFVGPLYSGPGSNFRDISGRFDIKRPFLSEDEHRELLGWLEDFMYRYKADMFVEYSTLLLLDTFAATLFPQTELRRIYDLISGVNSDIVTLNKTELKEKYLSESELQAERAAESARKTEAARMAHEQQVQKLRDDLAGIYDGSVKSLLTFLDKHFSYDVRNDAHLIGAEYLHKVLADNDFTLNTSEATCFMRCSVKLLRAGAITFGALKNYITKIEEAADNVENDGTAEPDFDFE